MPRRPLDPRVRDALAAHGFTTTKQAASAFGVSLSAIERRAKRGYPIDAPSDRGRKFRPTYVPHIQAALDEAGCSTIREWVQVSGQCAGTIYYRARNGGHECRLCPPCGACGIEPEPHQKHHGSAKLRTCDRCGNWYVGIQRRFGLPMRVAYIMRCIQEDRCLTCGDRHETGTKFLSMHHLPLPDCDERCHQPGQSCGRCCIGLVGSIENRFVLPWVDLWGCDPAAMPPAVRQAMGEDRENNPASLAWEIYEAELEGRFEDVEATTVHDYGPLEEEA